MKMRMIALLAGGCLAVGLSLPLPADPADETGVIVGKIEKCKLGFSAFCRFTVVADNGERKEIYVNRGESTIISVKGKPVFGVAPRKGRRIEVQYKPGKGGRLEALFMRYLPEAAAAQPSATTPENQAPASPAGAAAPVPAEKPAATAPEEAPAAGEKPPPEVKAEPAEPGADILAGRIFKVKKAFPKPPLWRNAIVTVVVDSGEKIVVDSTRDTQVNDAAGTDLTKGGKRVGAWKLRVGQRVEVKFTLAGGHRKVLSIRCLD